jgi:hypothetical protein
MRMDALVRTLARTALRAVAQVLVVVVSMLSTNKMVQAQADFEKGF